MPTPDESPFAVAGRLEALDAVARFIVLGDQALWLTPAVSLDGVDVGVRIIASGFRDRDGTAWVETLRPSSATS